MISIQEAINNFYKEKSKYELLLEKEKRTIIRNNNLSWKEKRDEYKKLKPKCINCNRPVGSIFTITHDTSKPQQNRIFRADRKIFFKFFFNEILILIKKKINP